jgi:hypothetical protein
MYKYIHTPNDQENLQGPSNSIGELNQMLKGYRAILPNLFKKGGILQIIL